MPEFSLFPFSSRLFRFPPCRDKRLCAARNRRHFQTLVTSITRVIPIEIGVLRSRPSRRDECNYGGGGRTRMQHAARRELRCGVYACGVRIVIPLRRWL